MREALAKASDISRLRDSMCQWHSEIDAECFLNHFEDNQPSIIVAVVGVLDDVKAFSLWWSEITYRFANVSDHVELKESILLPAEEFIYTTRMLIGQCAIEFSA